MLLFVFLQTAFEETGISEQAEKALLIGRFGAERHPKQLHITYPTLDQGLGKLFRYFLLLSSLRLLSALLMPKYRGNISLCLHRG